MIARHPYRAVGAVAAVFAVSFLLAGMIGQYDDGPWGGLPSWLGTTSYATSLLSSLALLLLSAYLGVAHLRSRRNAR